MRLTFNNIQSAGFVASNASTVSLPKLWIGYALAAAGFISSVVSSAGCVEEANRAFAFFIRLLLLFGELYLMFCIYRIHRIVMVLTEGNYPISPLGAVAGSYIPCYNLYWIYKWAREFAKFVNGGGYATMLSGNLLGHIFVVSMIVSIKFGRGSGLAIDLVIANYMIGKLRPHIESRLFFQVNRIEAGADGRI